MSVPIEFIEKSGITRTETRRHLDDIEHHWQEAPMDGKIYGRSLGHWIPIDGAAPALFEITSFNRNPAINELGATATITFSWQFDNGVPTEQSISGLGILANALRTVDAPGIKENTTFTLSATDGATPVTRDTSVVFNAPIWWGTVTSLTPEPHHIQAMTKRVAAYSNFTVDLSIANARSCFASAMSNPIRDLRDTIFNISQWDSFDKLDNVIFTLADGTTTIPYRICIRNIVEDTGGGTVGWNVVF